MSPARSNDPRGQGAAGANHELLVSLVQGVDLDVVVPAAVDLVSEDPLHTAGRFPGDVLRALMEVPGGYWTRHPQLYDRYRTALRAGAALRRTLPPDRRFEFWAPLGIPSGND
jgi:hypothetical protein